MGGLKLVSLNLSQRLKTFAGENDETALTKRFYIEPKIKCQLVIWQGPVLRRGSFQIIVEVSMLP